MKLLFKRPTPYKQFEKESLILRDQLALDRTILANERTMLAYARTVLGLFLAGGTILKLFPGSPDLLIIAVLSLALGVFITAIGAIRFFRMRKELSSLSQNSNV